MRRIAGPVLALTLVLGGTAPAPHAAPTREERWPVCGEWRRVPVKEDDVGAVNDVAVVSPTEAWLVADEGYESYNVGKIYRWNNVRWSRVKIPEPTTGDIPFWELTSLAIVSPTEIWAVGYEVRYDSQKIRPISAVWNGTRWRWVHIEIPHLRGLLEGLAVVPGTQRLWAVGYTYPGRAYEDRRTFVLVWNGKEWRQVESPSPGRWSEYRDVVSVGGSTWALGTAKPDGSAARLLASKWTGHGWTVHHGPRGYGEAVDGLGAQDLWAVGWTRTGRDTDGLIAHWDGRSWSLGRRLERVEVLVDVHAAGPGSEWAVGSSQRPGGQSSRPYILRRSGGQWRVAFAPNIVGVFTAIGGTPHNLWAFRSYNPDLFEIPFFDSFHRC